MAHDAMPCKTSKRILWRHMHEMSIKICVDRNPLDNGFTGDSRNFETVLVLIAVFSCFFFFSAFLDHLAYDDFVLLMTKNYRVNPPVYRDVGHFVEQSNGGWFLNTRPKIMHIFFFFVCLVCLCAIHSKVNVVARAEKVAIYRPYGHIHRKNTIEQTGHP